MAPPASYPAMGTLVILNPTAGGRKDPDALQRRLEPWIDGDFVSTRGPGEAVGLASEAARSGYESVVAVGGDGTVREVATGLHLGGAAPRLGIIPAGTGNDLAWCLGIPAAIERAAAVATDGRTAALDLVQASRLAAYDEPRYLVNAAVAGFGGRIGDAMTPAFRRRFRRIAYPLAALGQVRDLRPYSIRVEVDGRGMDAKALMVVVANGEYAGGRIRFVPGASTGDGLLDLVVVHAVSPGRLATLIPRVLSGRHPGTTGISMYRGASVRIHADRDMWINLDGDTWQPGPAGFRVLPAALRVAVP
ncbi:MAG: diacylglycerol kinase family lipid kinase [Gemmatimonadetes bacterium]|nr:diacylglycerol kinase family lipid kinase [Gemmatimonadota bacterium]NNK49328.1 diacylglycerol kinase family lipid kinase [Gemmatimonadota bacterium]